MAEIEYDVLIRKASKQMLSKEHPKGRNDWVKVMNFIAWNIDFRDCLQVCLEIARLHKVPLRETEIKDIVDFQTYDRAARELASKEKTAALLSDAAIRAVEEFFGDGFKEQGG
jgi:hypothetical protein